jgi:hypothetical protein
MRPASVVVRDPLTEDSPQVALTERDHLVQTFATDCRDQSFTVSDALCGDLLLAPL